jgi:hypothetical protein
MNIGYDQILQMRRVEEKANALGFMFAHPGDRGWSYPADHELTKQIKEHFGVEE